MGNKIKSSPFKMIVAYAGSHYLRQALNLILAFIRPKLLGPEMFGLWNLLKIIPEYSTYAQLGTRSALRFTLPHLKDDPAQENKIISSAYWGALFPNCLIALFLLGSAFSLSWKTEEQLGIISIAIIVLLAWRYHHAMALLKSYKNFTLISKTNVLSALLKFFLSISLIYFFGIYGCYITEIVVLLCLIFFIFWQDTKKFTIKSFHWPSYIQTLKIGFPIVLLDAVEVFIRSADRYIIAYYGDTKAVGYYGLAIMISGFMLNLPGASREVMEAELMHSSKKLAELFEQYCIKPMLNIAYIMPIFIGAVFFVMPHCIRFLLPRYEQGIIPAQIISFAAIFMALSFSMRGIIVIKKKQIHAALLTFPVAILNIVLNIYAMKNNHGINGVALATCITLFVHFCFLYIFTSFIAQVSFLKQCKTLVQLSFPIFGIVCGFLLGKFINNSFKTAIFFEIIFSYGTYLLVIFLFMFLGRKNHTITWRK